MPGSMNKPSTEKAKWVHFKLYTQPELAEALSNYLTEMGAQGVFEEFLQTGVSDVPEPEPQDERVLNAYFPSGTDDEKHISDLQSYINNLAELFPELKKPTFNTEVIIDPQWGEVWKRFFKPLRITKNIIVKPSWERYSATGRETVIEIDPGMAFGTGQHPSTSMCIEAMEEILLKDRTFQKWRVLDVGTGTGILGISAAKLGASSVMCVDIDDQAVEIAHKNVAVNHVGDRVVIVNSDVAKIKGTFELIVANLTAETLIKIKSHLVKMMEKGGYLVISGIFEKNRQDVEKAFTRDDLISHKVIADKEWVCYVYKKPAKA
ncbi:MAG TPA: 50S ribosomal protein L11 methyltransferase [Syntrophales bacterium]